MRAPHVCHGNRMFVTAVACLSRQSHVCHGNRAASHGRGHVQGGALMAKGQPAQEHIAVPPPTIGHDFSQLLHDGETADVTFHLIVDGSDAPAVRKAHSLVLKVCFLCASPDLLQLPSSVETSRRPCARRTRSCSACASSQLPSSCVLLLSCPVHLCFSSVVQFSCFFSFAAPFAFGTSRRPCARRTRSCSRCASSQLPRPF